MAWRGGAVRGRSLDSYPSVRSALECFDAKVGSVSLVGEKLSSHPTIVILRIGRTAAWPHHRIREILRDGGDRGHIIRSPGSNIGQGKENSGEMRFNRFREGGCGGD